MTEQHEWGPWHPWCSTYRCIHPGCYKNMPSEEVAKRLNEYETLEKATEALSAEDASWCAGVLMEATNNHGVEQKFNRNPYYLADVLKDYADILKGK